QLLKVRQALLVERHDLTVQPAVAQAQFGQSLGLLRQALRPVMPIASKQAHLTAADPRQNAVTVELHLIQPIAFGRPLGQGRQLWRQAVRELRLALATSCRLGRRLALGSLARATHQRTADHALRLRLDDVVLVTGTRRVVALLDQQPLFLVAAAAQPRTYQRPVPGQLLAHQGELELSSSIGGRRIALGLPDAMVPDDHVARAIVAFGDAALEAGVIQRVILDMYRQALLRWVQARPLGHRPALQGAVQLQAKIVVQATSIVFLHHESQRTGLVAALARLLARFAGLFEIAFAVVFTLRSGHGRYPGLLACSPGALAWRARLGLGLRLALGLATQAALEQLGQVDDIGAAPLLLAFDTLDALDLAGLGLLLHQRHDAVLEAVLIFL